MPFWDIYLKISVSRLSFPTPKLWNSALGADFARSHFIIAEVLSKREDEAWDKYVCKPRQDLGDLV